MAWIFDGQCKGMRCPSTENATQFSFSCHSIWKCNWKNWISFLVFCAQKKNPYIKCTQRSNGLSSFTKGETTHEKRIENILFINIKFVTRKWLRSTVMSLRTALLHSKRNGWKRIKKKKRWENWNVFQSDFFFFTWLTECMALVVCRPLSLSSLSSSSPSLPSLFYYSIQLNSSYFVILS